MSVASRQREHACRYWHGFPTWEEFRAWQRIEIARYTDTPEAQAGRAAAEAAFADGIPYDLDHFPLVTQPEPVDV